MFRYVSLLIFHKCLFVLEIRVNTTAKRKPAAALPSNFMQLRAVTLIIIMSDKRVDGCAVQ